MAAGTVVIVGQGYVGLPVAMRAVAAGYTVIGVDLDKHRVDGLRRGISYVDDVTNDELTGAIESGRYMPTDDYTHTADFDIAVITVPTPLKESLPDLSFIEQSSRSLAVHMKSGATVILESTTYPGTTEELVVPILEEGSGLAVSKEFFVGYSPERIDPGNSQWNFVNTPKVVSGLEPESLKRVREFYENLVDTTVSVSTPKEAELTKLLENTFRHVNIALVNELAIFADQLGINVWESINAASSKPFGFMKFTPGPGVGGHCLPIDPSYLSWQVRRKLGKSFRFVELANDINDHMPDYIVQRISMILNKQQLPLNGSEILLVGLAYKKNTGDIRESPSLRLIDLLLDAGANITAADDHIEEHRWPEQVARVNLSKEAVEQADIAVLITDHDDFDMSILEASCVSVFDSKNRLSGNNVETL